VINDDAYVALTIRSKGFRIKVARHALVWIGGPRTPVDYVHQRSRILKGHLQIVREQNKIPTTFEFTFASAPRKNMGILKRTIAELGSSYVPSLFVALPLEALSLGIAAVSSLLGRSSDVWRLAESTKEVSA
jgi:cellulose synthase/poly-beta-1,6-N-acetylglucosamine synthase-like glycosyltransferase